MGCGTREATCPQGCPGEVMGYTREERTKHVGRSGAHEETGWDSRRKHWRPLWEREIEACTRTGIGAWGTRRNWGTRLGEEP